MKLNKWRVHWLVRQKQKGMTSKDLAATMKLSRRRVEQVWKYYQDTGQELPVGEKMGPPTKPFDANEAEIVKEAYGRYKFGARMLESIIRKVYKVRISHSRIHMYLLAADLAGREPNKQKRRRGLNSFEMSSRLRRCLPLPYQRTACLRHTLYHK
jgi:putative transposase